MFIDPSSQKRYLLRKITRESVSAIDEPGRFYITNAQNKVLYFILVKSNNFSCICPLPFLPFLLTSLIRQVYDIDLSHMPSSIVRTGGANIIHFLIQVIRLI